MKKNGGLSKKVGGKEYHSVKGEGSSSSEKKSAFGDPKTRGNVPRGGAGQNYRRLGVGMGWNVGPGRKDSVLSMGVYWGSRSNERR